MTLQPASADAPCRPACCNFSLNASWVPAVLAATSRAGQPAQNPVSPACEPVQADSAGHGAGQSQCCQASPGACGWLTICMPMTGVKVMHTLHALTQLVHGLLNLCMPAVCHSDLKEAFACILICAAESCSPLSSRSHGPVPFETVWYSALGGLMMWCPCRPDERFAWSTQRCNNADAAGLPRCSLYPIVRLVRRKL